MTVAASATRPRAAVSAAVLAVIVAAGAALMAVSHAGVTVPLLAALGPGGDRALPGVAAGFAVAALVFAVVAVATWRRRPWAWAVGLAVNTLALVAATMPWRGPVSGVAAVVTVAAIVVLVSPGGRAAFLTGQRS